MITSRSDEVYLFPTPVGLGITTGKSQLLNFGAVGEHHPDFFFAGTAGLKHDVPRIRGPRWKIVSSTIVRKLYELLAGNIHEVNIGRARRPRAILSNPGERQELPIRGPSRGNSVSLIGEALLVGAIGFHRIDLWEACAPADKSDLSPSLAVPDRGHIGTFRRGHAPRVCAGDVSDINLRLSAARRREGQFQAVRRPCRRQISPAKVRETDHPVEIERVHHNLPTALGQG